MQQDTRGAETQGTVPDKAIFAEAALLPEGWREQVRIGVEGGRIVSVEADSVASAEDERHALVVPGMPNLHSHAFQRAMAGLSETRGPGADSFWSWRTVMYRLARSMTPDQVRAVAAQLYVEMLEAGFSRVGEFHYLHHNHDGRPYDDIGEMAAQIAGAAAETGIGLTLLPVLYVHSGFGGSAAAEGQRRFINTPDSFGQLFERCGEIVRAVSGGLLGLAPHSLRAVTPEELRFATEMAGERPIHIHIAEQLKEVEDCVAWSGARPVEWLLDNAPVDGRWCLIHATHMTPDETARMAASGAVAGLCPITEANLGDGIFNGEAFQQAGGWLGVGSDSNIEISLSGELRQLEYSQRLGLRARNVMAGGAGASTGQTLFEAAVLGGGIALDAEAGIATGRSSDLVSLSTDAAPWLKTGQVLDAFVFAGGVTVDCVWTAGQKQVENGRHRLRDAVRGRFMTAMRTLLAD